MLHPHRIEGIGRVARPAVVVTGNVAGILALGTHSVVATEAGAARGRMIHMDYRREGVEGVTQLTIICCGDVSNGARRRADSGTNRVAACAGAGCALEDTSLVAEFARQIPMRSLKLIAGCQVVELRALHR